MLRSVLVNSSAGFYVFASDASALQTGKTGLTLTSTLSKNGAAAVTVAPTITEVGNGLYWIAPIAAHRDTLGEIAWQFSGTSAVIAPRIERVVAVDASVARFGAPDMTDWTPALAAMINSIDTDVDALAANYTGVRAANLDFLDVASSTRLAASSYVVPPSASVISGAVNTDLTAAHGSGSYQTADITGIPRVGQTHRHRQVANNGTDSADVIIEVAS